MYIGPTLLEDTFAEAFGMRYTRLVVTAHDEHWLLAGATEVTGFGASVISCDVEAGIERTISPAETPDGRPGVSLLFFAFSEESLTKAVAKRTGQCLMTCPTTAVYDGLPDAEKRLPLGKTLRYFGDGFQMSKQIDGRRLWRIPVMDGEFTVASTLGIAKGVAGGNLIIQGETLDATLASARRAVEAVRACPGVIAPFPGGVARSGSKVGSRYKKLIASTADAYCPTLRGRVEAKLHPAANCALELVIDGVDEQAVADAMIAGLHAAAGDGIAALSAGNYGGKLGKYQFHLHELISRQ